MLYLRPINASLSHFSPSPSNDILKDCLRTRHGRHEEGTRDGNKARGQAQVSRQAGGPTPAGAAPKARVSLGFAGRGSTAQRFHPVALHSHAVQTRLLAAKQEKPLGEVLPAQPPPRTGFPPASRAQSQWARRSRFRAYSPVQSPRRPCWR